MSHVSTLTLLRDSAIRGFDLHSTNEPVKVHLKAEETTRHLKAAKEQVEKEIKPNPKLPKELEVKKKVVECKTRVAKMQETHLEL